jgi:hypothetical protein
VYVELVLQLGGHRLQGRAEEPHPPSPDSIVPKA